MTLSVDNLTVAYSDRTVLSSLNLEVGNVGVITLLGSSGSGKSTFLRVISGLDQRNGQSITGTVRLDGQTPADFSKSGKLGFMFQEPSLLPQLTVEENIRLPLRLRNGDLSYAEHLIECVGLTESRHLLPHQLSGGMRTRVALARTIAPRPSFLLLDEPFTALDIAWRFRLYRELETLQSEVPMVTILVTHDIQEALLLSNRILVLGKSGEIVRDLKIDEPLPRILNPEPLKMLQRELNTLQAFFVNEEDYHSN